MKNCLVIGAGSDVGHAVCKELVAKNWSVIGQHRSALTAEKTLPSVTYLQADLGTSEMIKSFFELLAGKQLNALVYCAGYHAFAPISPRSDGDLQHHFQLNVFSFVDCVRFFLTPAVSEKVQPRHIVAVSSLAARKPESGLLAYCASKAALNMSVQVLASEYARKGVRVNSISPGWLESQKGTENTIKMSPEALQRIKSSYPLGFGALDDVARTASFLLSEAGWITGQDLVVDGGRSLW